MNTEDKLFTLMAHAEDLQRVVEKNSQDVKNAAYSGTQAVVSAIKAGTDKTLEDVKNGLQEATTGLKAASDEAKATSIALRRTGLMQGVFLIAVAILLAGAGYFALGYIAQSRFDELAELKAEIRQNEATLLQLQAKTFGLELVDYKDGSRGIILPKGVKVDRTGAIPDGRTAVVIR